MTEQVRTGLETPQGSHRVCWEHTNTVGGGDILVFTQQWEVQDDLQRFRDVSSLAASQESYLRYMAADRDPTLFLMRWTSAS